jgi:hypothetical protein
MNSYALSSKYRPVSLSIVTELYKPLFKKKRAVRIAHANCTGSWLLTFRVYLLGSITSDSVPEFLGDGSRSLCAFCVQMIACLSVCLIVQFYETGVDVNVALLTNGVRDMPPSSGM